MLGGKQKRNAGKGKDGRGFRRSAFRRDFAYDGALHTSDEGRISGGNGAERSSYHGEYGAVFLWCGVCLFCSWSSAVSDGRC